MDILTMLDATFKRKEMSEMNFTLTEQHIKLLREMWVCWDDVMFGAPAINPKRPYGNGDVETDLADILSLPFADEDTEQRARLCKLHKETEHALQIVLTTGAFEPGDYVRSKVTYKWERVK